MHAENEDDDAVADGDGGDGGGDDGDGDDGENYFIHLMLTILIILMKSGYWSYDLLCKKSLAIYD